LYLSGNESAFMKKIICYCFVLISLAGVAQINYARQNINLISLTTPNFGVNGTDGRLYSGCWGWYQQSKNKEYAICGASNGTYFMDISNPATPTVCAYVLGKLGCTWREMKTYQNFCYIISDDPAPNKFQIIDMQYLPDSVHIVHNGTSYFEHAHTLWIDKDKMYIGSVTYSTAAFSPMNVYSLATPSVPVLLRELSADIQPPLINAVHDMYTRNDTIYASCGFEGLYVLKYNNNTNTFSQLGSYSGYANSAYNHSSWLTQNGKYLIFCDEVPVGRPIHFVDVQNLGNIQPLQTFKPFVGTTPHNPYLIGNDYAIVSCYQDGLYIYNISQPGAASVCGYFDTHHQGGANVGNYFGADYRGNWGAYPFLPSKIIIAQDMQNGVFLLDATAAFSPGAGIQNNSLSTEELMVYPNPAAGGLLIKYEANEASLLSIMNVLGEIVYEENFEAGIDAIIDTHDFKSGTYMLSVTNNKTTINKKLIIYN
jgi:choice-of-anchor B domain-containing protein